MSTSITRAFITAFDSKVKGDNMAKGRRRSKRGQRIKRKALLEALGKRATKRRRPGS